MEYRISIYFTVMFCFLNYLVGHMSWDWIWLTLFVDLVICSTWRKK